MRQNTYTGILEDWKFQLIVGWATCLGFHEHEMDDAIQELVLEVLAFRFDPAKSNGASEITALTTVISKRLISVRRAGLRYCKRIERLKNQHGVDEARDRWPIPVEDETPRLILDVQTILANFSPRQRHLCEALLTSSCRDISRDQRCSWESLCHEIAVIRQRFIDAGLTEYLT